MDNNNKQTTGATDSYIITIVKPLQLEWKPKEDITTYELAMCLPFFIFNRCIMPYDVDESLPHFRHFKITDPNKE